MGFTNEEKDTVAKEIYHKTYNKLLEWQQPRVIWTLELRAPQDTESKTELNYLLQELNKRLWKAYEGTNSEKFIFARIRKVEGKSTYELYVELDVESSPVSALPIIAEDLDDIEMACSHQLDILVRGV